PYADAGTRGGRRHDHVAPSPLRIAGARDPVSRRAGVRSLAGTDLDRDRAAAREVDESRVHGRRADGAVVGVDVRPPDRSGTSVGRTRVDEPRAVLTAEGGRVRTPV